MANKTRTELENEISDMCDQCGCKDKIRAIHKTQFVDRRWNPHPAPSFVAWWNTHADFRLHKIDATRAVNCQCYMDEYFEARQLGLA